MRITRGVGGDFYAEVAAGVAGVFLADAQIVPAGERANRMRGKVGVALKVRVERKADLVPVW